MTALIQNMRLASRKPRAFTATTCLYEGIAYALSGTYHWITGC
jgi:hypothetical protein